MKIHLIAIGGAIMHNLALALQQAGHLISGSDDEIFEPSKSRLLQYELLPKTIGWNKNHIHPELDLIILGMHAKEDNVELLEAQKLKIPVYNFPEFIYKESISKMRIAICGSHGKTTITSMIMHCLKFHQYKFDYLVGALLDGFHFMVQLSDAPMILIEGDEYFASTLDKRPKFLFYHPQITLISGIAWDHFNVFPTEESYLNQFALLLNSLDKNALLFVNKEDATLMHQIETLNLACTIKYYSTPMYEIDNEKFVLKNSNQKFTFQIFGRHNMQNMEGAKNICMQFGMQENNFYEAMQTFTGASKRLETIFHSDHKIIVRDFAHAPSKVKASTQAIREMYPTKKVIACLELHTFSSLNKKFIPQYQNSLQDADVKIVFYNKHTLELKRLPDLNSEDVKMYFNDPDLNVCTDINILEKIIFSHLNDSYVLLFMSSGNFEGLDFQVFV